MTNPVKIHRLPGMCITSGKSRSAIYAEIKSGTWPPQVKLGGTSVGWLEHEIDAVLRARAAGQTDDEVRNLVKALVQQRACLPFAVKAA